MFKNGSLENGTTSGVDNTNIVANDLLQQGDLQDLQNPRYGSSLLDEDIHSQFQPRVSDLTERREFERQFEKIEKAFEANGEVAGDLVKELLINGIHTSAPDERGRIARYLIESPQTIESVSGLYEIVSSINLPRSSPGELKEFFEELSPTCESNIANLFSVAPNERSADNLAKGVVRVALDSLVESIEDDGIRHKYQSSDLSDRELIEAMEHVSGEKQKDLILHLHNLSAANEDARLFLRGKLNNILHFVGSSEKIELIGTLLGSSDQPIARQTISDILQSSSNSSELQTLVNGAGSDELFALNDPNIKNLVAASILQPAFVELLARERSSIESNKKVDSVGSALMSNFIAGARTILQDNSELQRTKVFQTYTRGLAENLLQMSEWDRRPESTEELTGLMLDKMTIEFQYGVRLSVDHAQAPTGNSRWGKDDIKSARESLEAIGEGTSLTTPGLHNICLVPSIGPGIMGVRLPKGDILISSEVRTSRGIQVQYPGESPFKCVLVHEIGHGVQMGDNPPLVMRDEDGELIMGGGNDAVDFEEFLQLSGWELVNPDRWDVANNGLSIKLDGVDVPLDVPIHHNGSSMLLTVNQGILFQRDIFASFSLVDYSQTNPWEDWAEAFAEYHIMPERLIAFSPEKFQYLEQEFRKYQEDNHLQDLLNDALERRKLAKPHKQVIQ